MKKTALRIGIAFSVISGYFTVDFLSGMAATGVSKAGYGFIGLMLAFVQAYSLIYGVKLRERFPIVSTFAIGVFAVTFGLSVAATVGSFTASNSEKAMSVSIQNSDSLKVELDSLFTEKIDLNGQIKTGLEKGFLTRAVDPARARLSEIEKRISEIQTDLRKQDQPDDPMFLSVAQFFGGESAQSARLYLYLIIALMIELIAAVFLVISAIPEGMYTPRRTEYTPDFTVYTPDALLPSPSGALPESDEKKKVRTMIETAKITGKPVSLNAICQAVGLAKSGYNHQLLRQRYPDLIV